MAELPCQICSTMELVWQKKVNEYDQEIPQSHISDQPKALWGRATEYKQSQDIGRQLKKKATSSLFLVRERAQSNA